MKEGIHPKYHPVIFVDASTGDEVITRSTMTSAEKRTIDGVEHFVVSMDITSFSHPFFTGKQKLVDTEGRIDRFRKKYG
jgi:large subunit ribosomal protein L31